MFSLQDKVSLVTGGSRGIGRATALALAQAGADVAVNYHSEVDAAQQVTRSIQALGRRAVALEGDVSSESHVKRLVEKTVQSLGGIDILVANAGVWKRAPVTEMSAEQWEETLDINLKGAFFAAKHAARFMVEKKSGRIIFISSTAGQRGEAFHSHYAASKGGIISFTKSLATELGPDGILVNCVAPGWVDTDMSHEAILQGGDNIRNLIPINKIPTADELAGPIVFLASEWASAINGEILNVNSGSVLCG